MKYLAIIAALIAGPAASETLVVNGWSKWSSGGEVRRYLAKRDAVDAIEVRGRCVSSCAVFLSHGSVCVGRRASVGFHALIYRGKMASRAVQSDFTRYLGSDALGEWFLGAPSASTKKVSKLRGSDLIDNFGFKECEA